MTEELTERFVDALHTLYADRDVEPLVTLFADDAKLSKLDEHHAAHGQDGARSFWQEYRAVFDDIEATFSKVVRGDGSVALEWESTGTLSGGGNFGYRGISVLDGGDDGHIHAFRTYYDTAAFRPSHPSGNH